MDFLQATQHIFLPMNVHISYCHRNSNILVGLPPNSMVLQKLLESLIHNLTNLLKF